jgi:hypothetical protein
MHVLGIGDMPVGEHVPMVVRHDRVLHTTCSDLAPTDHNRNVDAIVRHLLEAGLQFRALW